MLRARSGYAPPRSIAEPGSPAILAEIFMLRLEAAARAAREAPAFVPISLPAASADRGPPGTADHGNHGLHFEIARRESLARAN
jgi:hypothetical protein